MRRLRILGYCAETPASLRLSIGQVGARKTCTTLWLPVLHHSGPPTWAVMGGEFGCTAAGRDVCALLTACCSRAWGLPPRDVGGLYVWLFLCGGDGGSTLCVHRPSVAAPGCLVSAVGLTFALAISVDDCSVIGSCERGRCVCQCAASCGWLLCIPLLLHCFAAPVSPTASGDRVTCPSDAGAAVRTSIPGPRMLPTPLMGGLTFNV